MRFSEKSAKKSPKSVISGVRPKGRSRSSELILLKSPSKVFDTVSNKHMSVGNSFHARRASSGKITTFMGYPPLILSVGGSKIGPLKSAVYVLC